MKVSELLKQAKSLIEDEERWCPGPYVRDKVGFFCSLNSTEAYSFSSANALWKLDDGWSYEEVVFLFYGITGTSISEFENSCSHSELMQVWDAAIQKAEKLGL